MYKNLIADKKRSGIVTRMYNRVMFVVNIVLLFAVVSMHFALKHDGIYIGSPKTQIVYKDYIDPRAAQLAAALPRSALR